jgi:RNA exonuclease 1
MAEVREDRVDFHESCPKARLHISTKEPTTVSSFIGPARLADLARYLWGIGKRPKWTKITGLPLMKYLQILLFDGLDEAYYQKFFGVLHQFTEIMGNGFPLPVISDKNKLGIDSFLGLNRSLRRKICFKNYEEMLAKAEDLVDNGFPLLNPPEITGELRCTFFKLRKIETEELSTYIMLPDNPGLPLIVLDCEMIETTMGDECARLSVVDETGAVLLDEYYRPVGDILDLRTEFSGVMMENLERAKTTSGDIVKELGRFAGKDTIIVGHSLENDFRAMKLIHSKVIDTSIIYNRDTQYPYKPSLAHLYSRYIKRPFRVGDGGHDSVEDARASLDLVKYALTHPVHQLEKIPEIPELFRVLKPKVCQISVFGDAEDVKYKGIDEQVKCVVGDNAVDEFVRSIAEERAPVSVLHLSGLMRCESSEEERICGEYNDCLRKVRERIPNGSFTIIYGGGKGRKQGWTKEGGRDCGRGLCWVFSTSDVCDSPAGFECEGIGQKS